MKKILLGILAGLVFVAFAAYSYFAWQMALPSNAETLGQFTKGHSISQYFMSKGFAGQTFVRTNQPILDIPMTNTEFKHDRQQIIDIPYEESNAICQGIVDEQKMRRDLTAYLKQS